MLVLMACNPATPTALPPLPSPTPAPEVIFVDATTLWHFAAPTAPPASGWQSEIAFDDSAWLTGLSPIGNTRPARTFVEPDAGDETLYMRGSFNIADPTQWRGLTLQLDYSSGAAVYLNGVEIVRANLEAGAGHTSLALLTHNTPAETFDASPGLKALRVGENLLAIEVHRRTEGGEIRVAVELLGTPSAAPPHFVFGPLLGRLGARTITLLAEADVPAMAVLEYAPADSVTTTLTFSPTL